MDEDKREQNVEPLKLEFGMDEKKDDGSEKKIRFKLDVEDIIAIFAGIVAIIMALGMVFGTIPVNELTVGVLTFSGFGAAVAEIIAARKRKEKQKKN